MPTRSAVFEVLEPPSFSAARHWLRKHEATTAECSVYTQDIKELLMSPSEDDYREMYVKLHEWPVEQSVCGLL